MDKMKFSDNIQELLNTIWKNKDIYNMSVDELKKFREEVASLKEEYNMLQLGIKTIMNAAYGASANQFFYFFKPELAADITGECRETTKYMIRKLEQMFHEDIWERTDLQEKFNFKLDPSKHEWYRNQKVWVYSDTDSVANKSVVIVNDTNNNIKEKTIEDLYNECEQYGDAGSTVSGHTSVNCPFTVMNYSDKDNLYFAKVKRVIRHKVSKNKFKIKTKSGKEIIVTGDHSCVVFRDGKQITIKAKNINIKTDKILSIKQNGKK